MIAPVLNYPLLLLINFNVSLSAILGVNVMDRGELVEELSSDVHCNFNMHKILRQSLKQR